MCSARTPPSAEDVGEAGAERRPGDTAASARAGGGAVSPAPTRGLKRDASAWFYRSPPGTSDQHSLRLRPPPWCRDLCSAARPAAELRRLLRLHAHGAAAPSPPRRPASVLTPAGRPAWASEAEPRAGSRTAALAAPRRSAGHGSWGSAPTPHRTSASATTRGLPTISRVWRWKLSGHNNIW